MQRHIELMKEFAPGVQTSGLTEYGMSVAELTVQALKNAGPNLTRDSLIDGAENIRDYCCLLCIGPSTSARPTIALPKAAGWRASSTANGCASAPPVNYESTPGDVYACTGAAGSRSTRKRANRGARTSVVIEDRRGYFSSGGRDMEVVGWQRLHQSVWGSLHQVAPAPSERHRAPIPAPGPVSTFFVIGSGLLAPGGSASRGTAPAPRRGTAHEDLIVKTRWLDPGFLRFCRTSTSGEGYPAAGVSIGSGGKMEVWKKPPARS